MTDYERQADELEERSEKLGENIADAREDWKSKRNDESVPGTPPPDEDAGDDGAEREPWPDE
jgi:hypothetical protein